MTKLKHSKELLKELGDVKIYFEELPKFKTYVPELYSRIDKFVGGLGVGVYVFKTFNSKDVILKMFRDATRGRRLQIVKVKKSTDIKGIIKNYLYIKNPIVVLSLTRKGTKNKQIADLKKIALERGITFIVITEHDLNIDAEVTIEQTRVHSILLSSLFVLCNTKSGEEIVIEQGTKIM